ncbi:CapA family protein [Streptomyces sp. NPDC014882]|uniref:CapA family protein n=1 Tax=Streptomyces sp. NPDC014882 TaxID=3364927 RepID=UPI0036F4C6A3
MSGDLLTLFLCGDVMLGRGVDQILPCPGGPALRERYVKDARGYVELAEAAHGPITVPAGFAEPWGEALPLLDEAAPDARVINLETAVTRHDGFAPGKEVHYRMNPANLPCLTAARPDVCVLGNNHVLDFGRPGLAETLDALAGAGLRTAGAGRNADEACRPAVVPLGPGTRLLVLSVALPSSGVPPAWAATADRSGVAFADGPTDAAAHAVTRRVGQVKRPGDLVVVSVHMGSNWGYSVPREQTAFARALVDGGVDLVHGHSSHHIRPLEVHRGKLVLHGCGDFIDDYEGITGYEEYRDDLRPAHLATLEPDTGRLVALRIVPFRARRMRLWHAPPADARWMSALLARITSGFRPPTGPSADGGITLRPEPGG